MLPIMVGFCDLKDMSREPCVKYYGSLVPVI